MKKLPGTIQIDVDELWVLLQYFGFAAEESNIVYNAAIPRMLDLFAEFNIKATFLLLQKTR